MIGSCNREQQAQVRGYTYLERERKVGKPGSTTLWRELGQAG